ncbi:hypothetical protein IWQ62_001340 [Dispira parvispora]|uniref:Uncharacterized protein n=1 Tax=Dispira parvispora TaxID=1520584 RepID=A0A9W8AV97_9FUNG|nr:hypothetical protein IWQ62_001340 [Dispira parvispora]
MGIVAYASDVQRRVPHPQYSEVSSYPPATQGRRSWDFSKFRLPLLSKKSPEPTINCDYKLINMIEFILETGMVYPDHVSWLKSCSNRTQPITRNALRYLLRKDQGFRQNDPKKVLCASIEDLGKMATPDQFGRVVALSLRNLRLTALLLRTSYPHFGEIIDVDEKVLVSIYFANVLTVAIYRNAEDVVKYLLEYDSKEMVYRKSFLVGRYILAVHWRKKQIANLFEKHHRLSEATLSPRLHKLRQKYRGYSDSEKPVFDAIQSSELLKDMGLTGALRYQRMLDEEDLPMPLILLRPTGILECRSSKYGQVSTGWANKHMNRFIYT